MITAIKEIGELELKYLQANNGDILDIFGEDPSDGGRYHTVFFIRVVKNDSNYSYQGIEDRAYRSGDCARYLYRSGSGARGADVTPTAKLTKAKKTIPNKILRAISDTLEFYEKELTRPTERLEKEKKELEYVLDALKSAEKQIIADVENKQEELGKEGKYVFLTLLLKSDGEERWVGDWEIFREKFKNDCAKMFSEKYNKTSKAENTICAICLDRKQVFGFASTYQFYTLDKPGYVAGGFRQQDAWKNYPVCFDCAVKLELGKKYLEQHLIKSFYGRQMIIIPKTLWPDSLSDVLKQLEMWLEAPGDTTGKALSNIVSAEESLIDALGNLSQEVTYNLLFFEEKQSGSVFNILLNIEDVLPSRLHLIYKRLEEINQVGQFAHFPVGKGEKPFTLRIGIFNELFPAKTHNRYFLEMIYSLISGRPIDWSFLLDHIIATIKANFNAPEESAEGTKPFYTAFTPWRYYQLVLYLGRLGLLPDLFSKGGGELPMSSTAKYHFKDFATVREMFEKFFAEQQGLYDHEAKKACFLTGYLAQHLMNFQRQNLEGRMPFKTRLKGLNLTERDIRNLFREMKVKFMEYQEAYPNKEGQPVKFYPCDPEFGLLAEYIQAASFNWPLSVQEIGFFVAVGMNSKNLFSFEKEDELNGKTTEKV